MSENNRASVYVHINLINGKKYFGITTQNPPENRWRNGNGYYRNAHFMNAIKKYRWNNFAHHVLYRNIPINIAKNLEEMLIDEHMSYDPRFGYNLTHGGELEKRGEETKRKMSESMKGKNNPMKRPEVRAKLAKPVEAINPKTGEQVYCFESTWSAERAGFNHSNVNDCCNGKRKTHKDLVWRFIEGGVKNDGDN